MRIHILVIDREESYCNLLKHNLEIEGYEVSTVSDTETALNNDLTQYQLLIADTNSEPINGFEFVRRVRNNSTTETMPIILCSAQTNEENIIKGLNIGADDFFSKYISNREVIARIRAILRRTLPMQTFSFNGFKSQSITNVVFKTLRINGNEKTCYINDNALMLSRKEYDMLLFFLTHRERIFSREELKHNVWGGVEVTDRAVDTNIARLRQKIAPYGKNIETRLGFGYGFNSGIE